MEREAPHTLHGAAVLFVIQELDEAAVVILVWVGQQSRIDGLVVVSEAVEQPMVRELLGHARSIEDQPSPLREGDEHRLPWPGPQTKSVSFVRSNSSSWPMSPMAALTPPRGRRAPASILGGCPTDPAGA